MVNASRWMGICFTGILLLSLSTILAEDDKEKKDGPSAVAAASAQQ